MTQTKMRRDVATCSTWNQYVLSSVLYWQQSSYTNKETARLESAVDYYFIQQDGTTFRATRPMHPYFYIGVKQGAFREVENYLRRRFQEYIADVVKEEKIDLGQVG